MRARPSQLIVVALLVGVAAHADDAGTGTHVLQGTWKLDSGASSDLAPVLEHFDANFVVRKFANSVAPTNTITWGAGRFELKVHAVTVTRVSSIVLDGTTPTADDLFGNPYTFTSALEGQAVVSRGFVTRKDGAKERLEMRRTVEPDGTMVLKTMIHPASGPALEVKRVFNRVAP